MKLRDHDLIFQCQACGHLWWEKVDLPMNASAFIERLKGMCSCPGCGHKDTKRGPHYIAMLTGERAKEAQAKLEAQ